MNQHQAFEPVPPATTLDLRSLLRVASPAMAGFVSVLIAYLYQDSLFADLNNYPITILLFVWLFGTMMWCAFAVVRHAEASPKSSASLTAHLS